jgi:hypothetical protein
VQQPLQVTPDTGGLSLHLGGNYRNFHPAHTNLIPCPSPSP